MYSYSYQDPPATQGGVSHTSVARYADHNGFILIDGGNCPIHQRAAHAYRNGHTNPRTADVHARPYPYGHRDIRASANAKAGRAHLHPYSHTGGYRHLYVSADTRAR